MHSRQEVRPTLWMVGIAVQHGVTREVDTLLLKDAIHFPPEQEANPLEMRACLSVHVCECVCVPVLYEVLHVEVVDEQWVPQLGVIHCLIQRETCRVK